MLPRILIFLAASIIGRCFCIEFSFEDFGVLSDGVRKRLAYSWEADMEFEHAKKVVQGEIDRRLATGEVVLSGEINAPDLANKVASSMSELLSRRSQSVERVVKYVEDVSTQVTWDPTLDLDEVSIVQMKDSFDVIRNENFGDDVNKSFSAVHIPIDIYEGGIDILNDMQWSQEMDEVFSNNSRIDRGVNWQYFASTSGWLRQWPARQCHRDPDLYDARMEPWYLQGLAAPKHLLILIDTSGSTQGMIMRLIKVAATSLVNMLADWDRVSVATFSEAVSWPSCAHRFLPATPLNKQLLSEAIDELTSKGQAQLEPALRFALEQFIDLDNVSSTNYDGYDTCNKLVAILTDGDETFDPDDFVDHYRNSSVRIFVYGIGSTITGSDSLESLATKTNGEYIEIRQMNAIRHTIQNIHMRLSLLSSHDYESHPVLIVNVPDKSHTKLFLIDGEEGYQPSLSVAKPAYNRSDFPDNHPPKIMGVAGADIRTSELLYALNPVLYDPGAYAFVVAHNGYVLLHSRLAPRKIGPFDNNDPNIIAFTEVPIHVVDIEKSAVPLLSHNDWEDQKQPLPKERKVSAMLYYGNRDYASEEKRWLAYSRIENSSLGLVVSMSENGVERLEPTEKLPLDFYVREVIFGQPAYSVDLRRLCAAAGAIVDRHITYLRQAGVSSLMPKERKPVSTTSSTSTTASTPTFDDAEEDIERFGADPLLFGGTTTKSTTTTAKQSTTTREPPPDYGVLHQQAAIAFLQSSGNNHKSLERFQCDAKAVRRVGMDLILLRQLISSLSHLQLSTNDTVTGAKAHVTSNFHLDEDSLPLEDLFIGKALAWAVVFPSGVHFSRPHDGLAKACISNPTKLPVYQHAAYQRDRIFAQPAPCPEYSIVARSIHMRTISLATVIVVYDSSSLLPVNCSNCMLLDDGGFLLAASNETVALQIGTPLELLDHSLYRLLVQDSNVYTTHYSRMLVRPCPPGGNTSPYTILDTQESSGISHLMKLPLVNQLTSLTWWISLLSNFGRLLAEAVHTDESPIVDEDIEVEDEPEVYVEDDYEDESSGFEFKQAKCSRESLAGDWGLPRKGRICAIRHPTLIPGPSFYISQLRPFACGHHCTRTAAWAPVRGTNLLFVVADPPCSGCNSQGAATTRHASLFSYSIDDSFDTCNIAAGASVTSSFFSSPKYFERPEHIEWKCTPLHFVPPSSGFSVHTRSWYFVANSFIWCLSSLLLKI